MVIGGWSDASAGPLLPYIQAYYGISYTVVSTLFIVRFSSSLPFRVRRDELTSPIHSHPSRVKWSVPPSSPLLSRRLAKLSSPNLPITDRLASSPRASSTPTSPKSTALER